MRLYIIRSLLIGCSLSAFTSCTTQGTGAAKEGFSLTTERISVFLTDDRNIEMQYRCPSYPQLGSETEKITAHCNYFGGAQPRGENDQSLVSLGAAILGFILKTLL